MAASTGGRVWSTGCIVVVAVVVSVVVIVVPALLWALGILFQH